MFKRVCTVALCLGLGPLGCGGRPAAEPAPSLTAADADIAVVEGLAGPWRATLTSPGGPLPFGLRFGQADGELTATAINGSERVVFSEVRRDGRTVTLRIDTYDSQIVATVDETGATLSGTWTKTTPDGPQSMPFAASQGAAARFGAASAKPAHAVPDSVAGQWSIVFAEQDGSTFVGHAIFEDVGDQLRGTILTDTGDYRYLAGRYERGTVELSCFDGGHAFLFRAAVGPDGKLAGDFWSRGEYHATWTAHAMAQAEPSPLADPYSAVALADPKQGRFEFSFPDLEGRPVTDRDARFEGKVVLVDIFGTWCPNCNDYAPLLAQWHRRYAARGLEIVGLAFEMTGDVQRDRDFVGRYAKHHGLEFPLLLAGTSDKKDAAEALPSLPKVLSYPTTVFVGRDGRVAKIHSGFAGPATGDHHTRMVKEMEAEIEQLLSGHAGPKPGERCAATESVQSLKLIGTSGHAAARTELLADLITGRLSGTTFTLTAAEAPKVVTVDRLLTEAERQGILDHLRAICGSVDINESAKHSAPGGSSRYEVRDRAGSMLVLLLPGAASVAVGERSMTLNREQFVRLGELFARAAVE